MGKCHKKRETGFLTAAAVAQACGASIYLILSLTDVKGDIIKVIVPNTTRATAMKIVSYLRVSTRKQGESGLGLEAQRAAVDQHAKNNGCKIVAEFVEIESGKKADRPKLAEALAHAKSAKAMLVVAKLDRLARNVAFLSALMESGVEFVACDNPHASRLTIHILAAVAEDEARRISERTKAALKAARARGTKLGSSRPGHWKGREDRRQLGAKRGTVAAAKARTAKAAEHNQLVLTIIAKMRAAGSTWQSIADELTVQGHETPRGKVWSAQGVFQLAKQMPAS